MTNFQWQIFAYIVGQVEVPLVSAAIQIANAFLGYIAAPLKIMLVLYIALTGILILRGQADDSGSALLVRFLKLGLVVWLLTGSGMYQQYVYDLFFTILPEGLANVLTSSGGATPIDANTFDAVWVKAWRAGLEVWRTLQWQDIAEKAVIILFWFAAILSTVFSFAIWLISHIILVLFIAIGPLLVPLVLFQATRTIFERWIGALVSCIILQITTIVLLYIVLSVEQRVVVQVVLMGSVDPMAMIQVLLAGVIFFAVAGFVALQLPRLAASLSGDLNFHAGLLARSMQASLGFGNRQVADAVQRGASTAVHAGRANYQGIRTPPGSSLSDRAS